MRCHLDSFELCRDPGPAELRWFLTLRRHFSRCHSLEDARSHSRELHRGPKRPPRATLGRFSALFGTPGTRKNNISLERFSKIVTCAISAQVASSELQNPSKMVSETLSELPKTLPRAPREVPGASRRPLRSGPRRFQRHLSSARDLRSTSEAALKAFQNCFCCKSKAPSLLFFVFSCPWPLLSGLVWSVFCCFCSTLLRFCAPQFSWPFVATEVQLLLLF